MSQPVEQVKRQVDEVIQDFKNLISNVQKNKTLKEDELRIVDVTLLLSYAVLAILTPSLVRIFFGGWSFMSEEGSTRVIHEFVRVSGVAAVVVALFVYLGKRWKGAENDILRIMALSCGLMAVIALLILFAGGSFTWLFVAGLSGALTFFHAKESQLI
jgi:drug/metabolite transporter (DMT)-like permease